MVESREKTPFRQFLDRIDMTPTSFAEATGANKNTVSNWTYAKSPNPQTRDLQAALVALRKEGRPLRQLERLFFWLPAGEGSPPAWMRDGTDPFGPDPGNSPSPAEPLNLSEAARFIVLDGKRRLASGAIEDLNFVRGVLGLESWLSEKKSAESASPDTRQDSPYWHAVVFDNYEPISGQHTGYKTHSKSGESSHIIRLDDLRMARELGRTA